MTEGKKAILYLEDGTVYKGSGFGYDGEKAGEVVFNTALCGYEEILTDPSYAGQIVVMCYPHIGNYGINHRDAESYRIWVEGFIVKENSKVYSNYRAKSSLSDYMRKSRVAGLEGIDTRALVRKLRDKGSMKGIISTRDFNTASLKKKLGRHPSIVGVDLVDHVSSTGESVSSRYRPSAGKKKTVAVIDFGTKLNIIRHIKEQKAGVKVFPYGTTLRDLLKSGIKGVVLSNGPGDPAAVTRGIDLARELIEYNKRNYLPVLGICLGHQLLALAGGCSTYKLKFGHHGGNHPVKNVLTGRIEITVQNHNFCVDPRTITRDFNVTHVNLNDNTIEGIKHKRYPVISYQFHPEAGPGPHDSVYVFREFMEMISAKKK
ncbi:MAG: glutamine-hydrolyzing carbamoyl-phosphate synthase small subunit [Elusimicrobia bacterium]|nr:glutamine-hydrolyzing carbamoyl-phosphate synthase small subunit [Elusimicrobiota bacterium]